MWFIGDHSAHAASSGSCLDALAPASGEGGAEKSDQRRIRCDTYTCTSHDNDTFAIACNNGKSTIFFYGCNISSTRSLYIYDQSYI